MKNILNVNINKEREDTTLDCFNVFYLKYETYPQNTFGGVYNNIPLLDETDCDLLIKIINKYRGNGGKPLLNTYINYTIGFGEKKSATIDEYDSYCDDIVSDCDDADYVNDPDHISNAPRNIMSSFLAEISNGFIFIKSKASGGYIVRYLFNENITIFKQLNNEITNFFSQRKRKNQNKIFFICHDNDFYLKSVKINTNQEKYNISELYNDNFISVSKHIESTLKQNHKNGIVLLHGAPGTGKTSYLRRLISIIDNKRIIYVPSDLANNIAEPSFLRFLMDYKNAILILEDSENIIKERDAGGNPAIANLLNLTDGILGDALSYQIICTFNARIDEIDHALLRPGRLIAEYEFGKLSLDKTNHLLKNVNSEFVSEEPMTLAEIFSHGSSNISFNKSQKDDNGKNIGFDLK